MSFDWWNAARPARRPACRPLDIAACEDGLFERLAGCLLDHQGGEPVEIGKRPGHGERQLHRLDTRTQVLEQAGFAGAFSGPAHLDVEPAAGAPVAPSIGRFEGHPQDGPGQGAIPHGLDIAHDGLPAVEPECRSQPGRKVRHAGRDAGQARQASVAGKGLHQHMRRRQVEARAERAPAIGRRVAGAGGEKLLQSAAGTFVRIEDARQPGDGALPGPRREQVELVMHEAMLLRPVADAQEAAAVDRVFGPARPLQLVREHAPHDRRIDRQGDAGHRRIMGKARPPHGVSLRSGPARAPQRVDSAYRQARRSRADRSYTLDRYARSRSGEVP